MRNRSRAQIVDNIEAENAQDMARDMMVSRFGPSCAGWLVFDQRLKIHHTGAFDVILPKKVNGKPYEAPMWFGLAISYLKLQKARWSVEVTNEEKARRFRIRWKPWKQKSVSRETGDTVATWATN